MDVSEPRVRRRGFFLHSDTAGETDTGELENPEGFIVRSRTSRPSSPRRAVSIGLSRSGDAAARAADEGLPQIRSGSATGSRQRAHLPR